MSEENKNVTLPSSVSILGATGSVGSQALDVARRHKLKVDLLTANTDVAGMEQNAREFHPRFLVMADEKAAKDLAVRLADTDMTVRGGERALCQTIEEVSSPVTVHSILGEAGLLPAMTCAKLGKRLALANKECLVVAGDIVTETARQSGSEIIPVDSEHSAIFQCLKGGRREDVNKILLTASGGPFRGKTTQDLEKVTVRDALAHPTWKMGAKITVDSATLMNKGFEVIEAVRLFGVTSDQVQVVVHPESIIHSAVEFKDRTVIAQMAMPDMRLCIQYALTYPKRTEGLTSELDLFSVGSLHFYRPDVEAFPLLSLAFSAIGAGGGVPAVLNAANEIAVGAFLKEQLSFRGISSVVSETLSALKDKASKALKLDERIACDREAREFAVSLLKRKERV